MEKFSFIHRTDKILDKECPYLKVKIGSRFCKECNYNHIGSFKHVSGDLYYVECMFREHKENDCKKENQEQKDQEQKENEFSDRFLCRLHERLTKHQPISCHPSYGWGDQILEKVSNVLHKRDIIEQPAFNKEISRHVHLYLKNGKAIHYYEV